MALSQESKITINGPIITLGEIREFVYATENWGAATIVKVDTNVECKVKIEAEFGDIIR